MLRNKGFTLLEVLVAMSIFAIIGLGANQMLRTVIQTHDRTQAQMQNYSGLTRVFSVLERDFSQVVDRPVRDEYGETLPPLMVAAGPYMVEMSRTGWNNPTGLARSSLQRVAYQLNDGKLQRYFWLVLDRAEDSEPIEQTLLANVEDFRINLLDQDGNATDTWPDLDRNTPLPVAAEIILVTESLGEVRKVFVFTETAKKPGDPNQSDNTANQTVNPTDDADQNQNQPRVIRNVRRPRADS